MPTQAQYVAQPQPAASYTYPVTPQPSYTYAIPSMNSPTTTGSFAIPGSAGGAGAINPNDILSFLESYKLRQLGLQEQELGQRGSQFQQDFGLRKSAADLANRGGEQQLKQQNWLQQVLQGMAALPNYGTQSVLNFLSGQGMHDSLRRNY